MDLNSLPVIEPFFFLFYSGALWWFDEASTNNGTAYQGWLTFTVAVQCRPGETMHMLQTWILISP